PQELFLWGKYGPIAQKKILLYDAGAKPHTKRRIFNMHDNRNERINQISEDTLVIGVDIAKCVHYACAVDERGREVKKSFSFRQSRQGFETFYATILKVMESHQKKNVVVGFEPTGHYWMNLSSYLTDRGIRFVLVNP
ncbi:hypothetical protein VL12_21965, partial [Rossellomorea marisflavi]